jgi:PKD repeat protein
MTIDAAGSSMPSRAVTAPAARVHRLARIAAGLLLALALGACQSKNDMQGGGNGSAPNAQFSQDRQSGAPGLEVQFSDASSGEITAYSWSFGAAGTSSARNPRIRFDDPGVYTVALTVVGPDGESTLTKSALIAVDEPAQAGLDCLPARGFAPLSVVCTDASAGATSLLWDFGDGATSTEASPVHTYTVPGDFDVTQTATSAGGSDTATTAIEVVPLSIFTNPTSAPSAPVDVVLGALTGGVTGIPIWTVDGQVIGSSMAELYRFRQPGTYRIGLIFGEIGTGMVGMVEIDYVVGYGPAVADFAPAQREGTGPMTVAFEDRSTGAITRWHWDFGDGSECTYPAPAVAGSIPTCDAPAPTHVYDEVDSYDVTLTVTGPGAGAGSPEVSDVETKPNAVRVLMLDASFEAQGVNAEIGGAWTHLRPADALTAATHRALSTGSGAGEAGMPTEGSKWAVLDGLGTAGTTPVAAIENGIAQEFLRPTVSTVIELDYALLFAEPPAGSVLDAVTATVTEVGTGTVVEIPSARSDSSSAYHGVSTRYPTRDGSAMRVTPSFTAALDLATAFPGAPADARYVLTIRLSNAVNAFRSPRAYVDHVRFTTPAAPLSAGFSLPGGPIIAGEDIVFSDETCPDPGSSGCTEPTNWRWDFGTSDLPTPPTSSGSRAASPTYRFPVPGSYDVRLRVARADQASEATLTIQVVDGAVADFEVVEAAPHTAPATLTFVDRSTFDPADPIVAWSWDFGGFGSSSLQNPGPVVIGQAGSWLIRLEVTTASGQTHLAESVLTVE